MFDSVLNTPVRVTETHVGASIFRSNFSYGAVKSSVTDETFRAKIFSWFHFPKYRKCSGFPYLKKKAIWVVLYFVPHSVVSVSVYSFSKKNMQVFKNLANV